tara:strand:+ start:58 stop:522 length:465 start_codon:yes stop_codon:yes gene_type:complete
MNFKEYHGYKVWDNGMVIGKNGKLLRPGINAGGYLLVSIHFNGTRKTYLIHTLMGKLFLPNFDGLPTIDHIDQNRTNNSLFNLKWETRRGQNLNQGMFSSNTSGVKGVSYVNGLDSWKASISPSEYKRKTKNFKTKEEAIAQRLAWEEEYYNLT